ncbi:hypothetical protein ACUXOI_002395 [Staphylococcus capitis]|jgi:hypothetical protein
MNNIEHYIISADDICVTLVCTENPEKHFILYFK